MLQAAAAFGDPAAVQHMTDTQLLERLSEFHPDLLTAWVGTPEEPGPLTALILAGYAAGDRAVQGLSKTAAPPPVKTEYPIMPVDWGLVSVEAADFARQYSYNLITRLDQATMLSLREIMARAVQQGLTRDQIAQQINALFRDKRRSLTIAQTEANRIYTQGAYARMERAGVTKAKWQTVRDDEVCPICRPLRNVIGNIRDGWVHPGGNTPAENRYRGRVFTIPAHPNCRCFPAPVVEALSPQEDTTSLIAEFDAAVAGLPKPKPTIAPKYKVVINPPVGGLTSDKKTYREIIADHSDEYAKISRKISQTFNAATKLRVKEGQIMDEYKAKIFKIIDQMEKIPLGDPEWEALNEQKKKLQAERDKKADAAHAKWFAAERDRRLNVAKVIAGDKPNFEIKSAFSPEASQKIKTQGETALTWLKSAIHGHKVAAPNTVSFKMAGGRAYYYQSAVHLDSFNDPSIAVHELGHYIEDMNPRIHARCVEFLNKRKEDDHTYSLAYLTNNNLYRDDEFAYKDKFITPYVGKVYADASEVLSMGLQYMYEDPVKFRKSDPDHYNLILGIMRGDFSV